jgi:hypothetical protein
MNITSHLLNFDHLRFVEDAGSVSTLAPVMILMPGTRIRIRRDEIEKRLKTVTGFKTPQSSAKQKWRPYFKNAIVYLHIVVLTWL